MFNKSISGIHEYPVDMPSLCQAYIMLVYISLVFEGQLCKTSYTVSLGESVHQSIQSDHAVGP